MVLKWCLRKKKLKLVEDVVKVLVKKDRGTLAPFFNATLSSDLDKRGVDLVSISKD
jgi:hypothetical protein